MCGDHSYEAASEALERDWDRMVTFYDFPKEHWGHLRTTNPVESPFAALRLRTDAAKRYKLGRSGDSGDLEAMLRIAEQPSRLNFLSLMEGSISGTVCGMESPLNPSEKVDRLMSFTQPIDVTSTGVDKCTGISTAIPTNYHACNGLNARFNRVQLLGAGHYSWCERRRA